MMQTDDDHKEHGQQADDDLDQVICSNQLLAAIRERMAKQKKNLRKKLPTDPEIPERE